MKERTSSASKIPDMQIKKFVCEDSLSSDKIPKLFKKHRDRGANDRFHWNRHSASPRFILPKLKPKHAMEE